MVLFIIFGRIMFKIVSEYVFWILLCYWMWQISLMKVYWYPLRQCYTSTKLRNVTFLKIIFIVTAMRTLSLKCIFFLFFRLTVLKLHWKNMYLFTMLVNNINSDVLSTVWKPFLLLIQNWILMNYMKSQFYWQYFMLDLEFFLQYSFFPFLSGSYKPLLQCLIWKFVT